MTTQTNWPQPRDIDERAHDSVVYWSRFPDVVGLWTVLGEMPQPEEVRE